MEALTGGKPDPELQRLLEAAESHEPDPELQRWLEAAEAGDTAAVLDFLRRGMDINAGAPDNTALMRAVWRRQTAMIRLLIEHGADPGLVTGDGLFTAVTHALIHSRSWGDRSHVPDPDPRPLEVLLAAGGRYRLFDAVLLGDVELSAAGSTRGRRSTPRRVEPRAGAEDRRRARPPRRRGAAARPGGEHRGDNDLAQGPLLTRPATAGPMSPASSSIAAIPMPSTVQRQCGVERRGLGSSRADRRAAVARGSAGLIDAVALDDVPLLDDLMNRNPRETCDVDDFTAMAASRWTR